MCIRDRGKVLVSMLKNTLGWMAAALDCGGCSQPGSIVGMAPAELAMPKQIDVVFNHNARSRYRSPLTGEWRNGDDILKPLMAPPRRCWWPFRSSVFRRLPKR